MIEPHRSTNSAEALTLGAKPGITHGTRTVTRSRPPAACTVAPLRIDPGNALTTAGRGGSCESTALAPACAASPTDRSVHATITTCQAPTPQAASTGSSTTVSIVA